MVLHRHPPDHEPHVSRGGGESGIGKDGLRPNVIVRLLQGSNGHYAAFGRVQGFSSWPSVPGSVLASPHRLACQ